MKDYYQELSGYVALPDRMSCSLIKFAQRLKMYIKIEQEKIAPDNALIALLCDAARLGHEYIENIEGRNK